MGRMTETLENALAPEHRTTRVYRALAWVGLAAGSLFIVATVFFSGYVLGQHSGGGMHHGPHPMMLTPFDRPDGPGPGGPIERLTPPSAQPRP